MARAAEGFAKIEREHIERACRELIQSGEHAAGGSYFVRFEGRDLPAKRVVRDAYRYANEREIGTHKFSGGQFVARILQRLGFDIIVRQGEKDIRTPGTSM
jgi:hypothetical protein